MWFVLIVIYSLCFLASSFTEQVRVPQLECLIYIPHLHYMSIYISFLYNSDPQSPFLHAFLLSTHIYCICFMGTKTYNNAFYPVPFDQHTPLFTQQMFIECLHILGITLNSLAVAEDKTYFVPALVECTSRHKHTHAMCAECWEGVVKNAMRVPNRGI